jgi:hypothetical protein
VATVPMTNMPMPLMPPYFNGLTNCQPPRPFLGLGGNLECSQRNGSLRR